jgi:two-component system sensor histidine kinase ResE
VIRLDKKNAKIVETIKNTMAVIKIIMDRITKPLRKLSTQAINVSNGDYSQKTTVNTKDEIGELASMCS